MAASRRRSCSTDRSLGHNSQHGVARVLAVAGDWVCGRYVAGQDWPVVLAGECGETAVPVSALDKVPAKREGWVGWMLEVWEERTGVGREVVVWCSESQAAELSSVVHNRLVMVALAADGMVEVEIEWRLWCKISARESRGGCQHVWKSGLG